MTRAPPAECSLNETALCGVSRYGDGTYAGEGVTKIAEMLKVNKTLTSLSLDWNGIRDEGADSLAEALKTNSTLKELK